MPGIIGSIITAKEDEIEVKFVIIFCPDQILQSYLVLADKIFIGPSRKNDRIKYDMTALHCTTHNIINKMIFWSCMIFSHCACHSFSYCLCSKITRAS